MEGSAEMVLTMNSPGFREVLWIPGILAGSERRPGRLSEKVGRLGGSRRSGVAAVTVSSLEANFGESLRHGGRESGVIWQAHTARLFDQAR
jgi:hypothetical protein